MVGSLIEYEPLPHAGLVESDQWIAFCEQVCGNMRICGGERRVQVILRRLSRSNITSGVFQLVSSATGELSGVTTDEGRQVHI
jgi:hypothetical protein